MDQLACDLVSIAIRLLRLSKLAGSAMMDDKRFGDLQLAKTYLEFAELDATNELKNLGVLPK